MKTSRRRHIGASIGAAGLLVVVLGLGVVGCGGIVAPTQPPTNEQQQAPNNGPATATQGQSQTQRDGHIGDTLNFPQGITVALTGVTDTPTYDNNGAFLYFDTQLTVVVTNTSNQWEQIQYGATFYWPHDTRQLPPFSAWDGTVGPGVALTVRYEVGILLASISGPFQFVFIDGGQQVAWTFTTADIKQLPGPSEP